MIYYSSKARETAMNRIKELIPKIANIPGNILSYADCGDTISYLQNLMSAIESEERKMKEVK